MANFTLADLARTLREVAAERPDYIYEPPVGGSDCWYLHDNGPGCIFGHAAADYDQHAVAWPA